MTNTPVFAQTPKLFVATLTSPTAVTSRANITGTTGLTKLTDLQTNGLRVDSIQVVSKGTSSAGIVFVWLYDGTTSYLWDQIDISAVTGSTTLDSIAVSKTYTSKNLTSTQQLYVSISVTQDVNVFLDGGAY